MSYADFFTCARVIDTQLIQNNEKKAQIANETITLAFDDLELQIAWSGIKKTDAYNYALDTARAGLKPSTDNPVQDYGVKAAQDNAQLTIDTTQSNIDGGNLYTGIETSKGMLNSLGTILDTSISIAEGPKEVLDLTSSLIQSGAM